MINDLWIPVIAAFIIKAAQVSFIHMMKDTMWNVCKEKENL